MSRQEYADPTDVYAQEERNIQLENAAVAD
jgi:hypothetical protein